MITEQDKELILEKISQITAKYIHDKDLVYTLKQITVALRAAMDEQATIAKPDMFFHNPL